jgi:mevalonate kinase
VAEKLINGRGQTFSGVKRIMGDKQFYGHGKLLLSSEYAVLHGAKALAIPTHVGQAMHVKYSPSFDPCLHWRSFDVYGEKWFEGKFEFWNFDILESDNMEKANLLRRLLLNARVQNPHFLREEREMVRVETYLEFPNDWGLGSSSTLLYCLAQWAYIGPFELQSQTLGGSGYDIACAQSERPILFKKMKDGENQWNNVSFFPSFHEHLCFVYLNRKQDTRASLDRYNNLTFTREELKLFSDLTEAMIETKSLNRFKAYIGEHDYRMGLILGHPPLKDKFFPDFDGDLKSLGAWGGDFALAASRLSFAEMSDYFKGKGYPVVIPFTEMILHSDILAKEAELGAR